MARLFHAEARSASFASSIRSSLSASKKLAGQQEVLLSQQKPTRSGALGILLPSSAADLDGVFPRATADIDSDGIRRARDAPREDTSH